MNKLSEDEAIEIMLDNKKEYEEIIKELEDVGNGNDKPIETIKDCQKFVQAIETILDLYQHKKGRIDELKQELLQEKEKNEELREELDRQINTRIINEEFIEKNYISKGEIREKIKELEEEQKEYKGSQEWEIQDDIDAQINILQELLEEN